MMWTQKQTWCCGGNEENCVDLYFDEDYLIIELNKVDGPPAGKTFKLLYGDFKPHELDTIVAHTCNWLYLSMSQEAKIRAKIREMIKEVF